MFSLKFLVLCTGVLAASLSIASGLTDEEKAAIKTLVQPIVLKCGEEIGITEEEIKAAKEAGTLDQLDPCLAACVLKKIGLFNENGMFDEDKAKELTEKFLKSDEDQTKALEIIHTCSSVNDQSVGDVEKGCERAKLLFDCYMPLKGKLPGTP